MKNENRQLSQRWPFSCITSLLYLFFRLKAETIRAVFFLRSALIRNTSPCGFDPTKDHGSSLQPEVWPHVTPRDHHCPLVVSGGVWFLVLSLDGATSAWGHCGGRIDLLCGGGDKAVEWRMAPETTHIKGCTHRAIILYDGAINSHRKE